MFEGCANYPPTRRTRKDRNPLKALKGRCPNGLFAVNKSKIENQKSSCYNRPMRIALGADHAGYELKNKIREHLSQQGIEVQDEGTNSGDSVDYPDFAAKVGNDVATQKADRGILVCGTGIGMAISANKVHGVRSANITSEYEA